MNDQSNKLVELGFIYCLKNPITDEVFYVGATESAPKDRLSGHYQHFKEYLNFKRSGTKKFKYFEDIWPEIAKVELIEIIQNDYLYEIEKKYIKSYSEKFTLTNQTIGGEGGDTFTLQDSIDKEKISKLISDKQSGKKKPPGFAENLSKTRMGKNNPMGGTGTMPNCIIFDLDDTPLKLITAPFQITEFLDSVYGKDEHKKHAGRTGNISKGLKKRPIVNSSGYIFKRYEDCSKEIQDIVQQNYENDF